MSQRILYEIIASFEDGATRSDIVDRLEEGYPGRRLQDYLGIRLRALIGKGIIQEIAEEGTTRYAVDPDVEVTPDSLAISIEEFDREVTGDDLERIGITVTNIVASGALGTEVDLTELANVLRSVEYEPETSPMAVWRPFEERTLTVLIPASGNVTIVGCKHREELVEAIHAIRSDVLPLCDDAAAVDLLGQFSVHNIVATFNLGREFDLATLAVGLGLTETEYEPERFPGIVYKPGPSSTILLFRSGKVVMTSVTSFVEVLSTYRDLIATLESIGIPIDLPTETAPDT